MSRIALLCCLALLFAGPTYAEEDPIGDALDGLSGETMLTMVKELADDKMLGRKTGWKGGPIIEEWVASQFANFGLHPADRAGAYLEPYHFASTNVKSPIGCTVAGTKLEYGKDYSHLSYSGSGKVEAPVVFCGYGIDRPDKGYDDYKGVDVKGKIVIAIRGLPDTAESGLGVERFIGYKSSAAADKGAVGFILVENEKALTGTIQAKYYRKDVPGLWLSQAAVDKLLAPTGKKIADLKKAYDEGKGSGSFDTGTKAALEVHSEYKPKALGHNVLARIDGRDPDLKKEIVLVGAHCDHLGVGPDGKVFNGADDNASGTAVLVHLADILSLNKFRPKRTIVFCAFTGEEQGLHGSLAMATNSPFQGDVVAVLNMDMVGQGDPAVSCNGVGAYPEIGNRLINAVPKAMHERVVLRPRAGGGSDHWPFYERGIPAFAISTSGKHPNYHTPLDDAANIKAENLEVTAKVVGRWLVTLAAHEQPLFKPHGEARFLVHEALRPDLSRLDPRTEPGKGTGEALGALRSKKDVREALRAPGRPIVFLLRDDKFDSARLAELAKAGVRAVTWDATKATSAAYRTAIADAGMTAVRVVAHGSPIPPSEEGMLVLVEIDGPDARYAKTLERDDVCAIQGPEGGAIEGMVDALVKSGLDLSPGADGRKRARAWLGGRLLDRIAK